MSISPFDWPQGFVCGDCLATLSMDITAPFFSDMGLTMAGIEDLRVVLREGVQEGALDLSKNGSSQTRMTEWLAALEHVPQNRLPGTAIQDFGKWIRDTYTFVPADRPNWEMYEVFFHRWSVGMRKRQFDSAGCFVDAQAIFETYQAFLPGRRLDDRILESRRRKLSTWDEKIFLQCAYSLSEEEVDCESVFEPFGVVQATANRNYFQEFWEHLFPRLTKEEQEQLFLVLQRHYDGDFRLPSLVRPAELTRSIR
jgi:hypothetical protein